MAPRKITTDPARRAVLDGWQTVREHPLFSPLAYHSYIYQGRKENFSKGAWAFVDSSGHITFHPTRLATPEEWAYIFAHCLLHLGFSHFEAKECRKEWNIACDVMVFQFLSDLRFGRCPDEIYCQLPSRVKDEQWLYLRLCADGIPSEFLGRGTNGTLPDMQVRTYSPRLEVWSSSKRTEWPGLLGEGLRQAAGDAVRVAAGYQEGLASRSKRYSTAMRAREWFISSFPMLGALAAAFTVIEDREICRRLDISVAAVSSETKEIYINPMAGLPEEECRFVMAHELLHVGLRHEARRQGRDPFLWNVACDYVINGWLVEMQIGHIPRIGGLLDRSLSGLSAEAIYDRIANDMRMYRKLATLRGPGLSDMLDRTPEWWHSQDGRSLDVFYRECLTQGLEYHLMQSRGTLPAGLIEEIRALSQPPIPWDVELARWFDRNLGTLDRTRTYARPSRRQASTPDIPRPVWHLPKTELEARTFGVILDTSGSMDRGTLAKALGSIASYSESRDVLSARVVFCDANYYDQGYISISDIAGTVRVRGRGGTVLQPAVSFLEEAKDFPAEAPILIITDGATDVFKVRREHAYLMPAGRTLPFLARGEVFRIV